METRKRKRRQGIVVRVREAVMRGARLCRVHGIAAWRFVVGRCRLWSPVVLVDAKRARARRLRRAIARATRAQFRALGVAPPPHLLVVVQRVVGEERPLTALLQVFEDASGVRRHVLFMALSVNGEPVSDGEVVATLRQQLHRVVSDALGTLALTVPVGPSRTRPATVTPIRSIDEPPYEDAPPPDDPDWQHVDDGAYPVAAER